MLPVTNQFPFCYDWWMSMFGIGFKIRKVWALFLLFRVRRNIVRIRVIKRLRLICVSSQTIVCFWKVLVYHCCHNFWGFHWFLENSQASWKSYVSYHFCKNTLCDIRMSFVKKDTCNMKTYEHFSCSVAGQYLNREDSVIFFSTPSIKGPPDGTPKWE